MQSRYELPQGPSKYEDGGNHERRALHLEAFQKRHAYARFEKRGPGSVRREGADGASALAATCATCLSPSALSACAGSISCGSCARQSLLPRIDARASRYQ